MSFMEINGHRCRYQIDGDRGAPALVLSNSLGTSLEMWGAQISALTQHFCVVRYDTRGHGQSQTTPGDYTIELLGRDVLALTDALNLSKFAFCGLSMGGLIGQWLGINAGTRLHRLVLCNTAAKIGTVENWDARIASVLSTGMEETAAVAIGRWFTPEFVAANPIVIETLRQQLLACDPLGYASSCAAVRDADFRASPALSHEPLLFIAGSRDPVTTVVDAEDTIRDISRASLLVLDTAHLSNIGAANAFNAALLQFFLQPD